VAAGSIHLRHFRRIAHERLEDARFLLHDNRNTGAVYLAGYGIECILKALLLSAVPSRLENSVVESFRGAIGHSFDHLREQFVQVSGRQIERAIVPHFVRVGTWGTNLRYTPGVTRRETAEDFFRSVDAIMTWAERKL